MRKERKKRKEGRKEGATETDRTPKNEEINLDETQRRSITPNGEEWIIVVSV